MSEYQPTFYEILGVPPTANVADILAAHKESTNEIKTELPMLGKLAAESARKRMQDVTKARDVLLNEAMREIYDKKPGVKAKYVRQFSSQRQLKADTY